MIISPGLKVTTDILWRGALLFALMDMVFVSVLSWLVKPADLRRIKWSLVLVIAIFFCALFGAVASYIFWDPVYSYVFPHWSRWFIPPVYGLLFAGVGLVFHWLAFKIPGNAVITFCLLGGVWGAVSHIWAIYRGILDKPPMLQGASPFAAVMVAIFEFIFYWCVCLILALVLFKVKNRRRIASGKGRQDVPINQ